ncbi:hypothetical protein SAMN04488518_1103 [Pseudovibrio ascidiaceicola]|uniref:Uncharacterized protein n=1 Tax=Pseudovibrio ascidiaceicola TaxID=285279 RepID=A0A1I4CRZ0_9HYPH|nr:hypothetical protein [Pseudovibrio ascidiaceicola]SFK84022.1 hypothetical protein SAMN04488518_1103 [Pseudovibrio ascidiaceicola]
MTQAETAGGQPTGDVIDLADLDFSTVKEHPDRICDHCPNAMALFVHYEDFFPSPGAPFHLIMEGGAETNGTCGDNGFVAIHGLPNEAALVLVGEDAIEYKPENQQKRNPDYLKNQDIVRARLARDEAERMRDEIDGTALGRLFGGLDDDTQRKVNEYKRIEENARNTLRKLDADDESWFGWIWGALQGEWNDNPTTGQIIFDAALTAIPIIDQVGDLRDVSAIVLKLCDSKVREEEGWLLWLSLGICTIGLVPTVGSVVKGVLKTIFNACKPFLKATGDFLKSFKKAASPEMINSVMAVARFFSSGNAVKWLQDLAADFQKLIKEAMGLFKKFLATMQQQASKALAEARASWTLWGLRDTSGLIKAAELAVSKIVEFASKAVGMVEKALGKLDEVFQEFVRKIIKFVVGNLHDEDTIKALTKEVAKIFKNAAASGGTAATTATALPAIIAPE